jgi:hypothetical protein
MVRESATAEGEVDRYEDEDAGRRESQDVEVEIDRYDDGGDAGIERYEDETLERERAWEGD